MPTSTPIEAQDELRELQEHVGNWIDTTFRRGQNSPPPFDSSMPGFIAEAETKIMQYFEEFLATQKAQLLAEVLEAKPVTQAVSERQDAMNGTYCVGYNQALADYEAAITQILKPPKERKEQHEL